MKEQTIKSSFVEGATGVIVEGADEDGDVCVGTFGIGMRTYVYLNRAEVTTLRKALKEAIA